MSSAKHVRVPSYRRHKQSGQAVVTLNGRDFYLGQWGTQESKQAYDRLVGEWQTNGRRPPEAGDPKANVTVNEPILAYWRFAGGYYQKNGKPTTELTFIRESVQPLRQLYGRTIARDFGPLALKTCRHAMVEANLPRGVINNHSNRIKRIFKWAAENELVPSSVYHGLQAVAGLKRGRSEAREAEPIRPVPEEHIKAVVPFVSARVRAMIHLQLLTGMRAREVRLMRGCDLDTSRWMWIYRPESHKTEHRRI